MQKTYEWEPVKPADMEDDAYELFEGHIKLVKLTKPQRYRLLEKCGIDYGEEGIVFQGSKLGSMATLMEEVKEYVKEVKLKHLESGNEYKSWDDLIEGDLETEMVCTQVCSQFMAGQTPSKKSNSRSASK